MIYRYSKIIALIISLAIISIAFVIFMYNLANVSVSVDAKKINSEKIKSGAEVFVNFYGIPYVEAKNEEDLFFAVGYYHASARLWQMDYYRRLAGGRLSEIFGSRTVKIDKFMRTFDMENISKRNYDSLSGKSKTIIDAFCEGVNQYITDNSSTLSMEFSALNYKPKKWLPEHSLMIGKYLTFELSLSIWADLTFGEILEKGGMELFKQFIPDEEYSPALHINNHFVENEMRKGSLAILGNEILNIAGDAGVRGSSSGSNCWTFRNSSGDSVSSILANDAHLLLSLPSRWIQMKIKSPEIEAIGLTLPGIPLIMSGRNKDISWGITNIMVDGFDYFLEKVDDKQEYYLDSDSNYKKITYEIDTIKIAGKSPEIYYKRKTGNSYIISDFHIISDSEEFLKYKFNDKEKSLTDNNVVSFKWIGSAIGDEIYSLYKINTASEFEQVKYALRRWVTPGLNFHFCDKKGNMGLISAGVIPDRESDCNPNLPNPSWIKSYLWRGVTSLSDAGFVTYNPDKKFLSSANNKISVQSSLFISNYWEPESRAARISELLAESDDFSFRDAMYLQNDFLSVYAREIIEISTEVLDNYKNLMSAEEIDYLNMLKEWDFILSRASVEASVYTFFYEKLLHNTFIDELGTKIFNQYSFISSLPARKLISLMRLPDSELFDIKGTQNIENKEFIIFKSFRDGIDEFNEYFNQIEISKRTYGKIHTLTLDHPFSNSEFMKPAFSLGPFETGGNNTTINNGEWNINDPYKQVIGASMRIICDLSSDFVYSALPGGTSGDNMHPNYSDQLQIWLNGGYVKLPYELDKDSDEFKLQMIFKKK
ncbi:MAG: penicillin acylase family protein [Candidatus Kapaibacterium sp.]|jgi:penicillin amidase|nr:penicillin acylase family protein [Candidatus Kapabacteria bacterium]